MSKKFFVVIILSIILVFIGCFTIIRAVKNFVIIEKIFSEVKENVKKENYYLRTTINDGENITVTKIYYKNGIGKFVSNNGIYTWVDGEKAYLVNEEKKVISPLDIEESKVLVSKEMFASFIPGYSKTKLEKFFMFASLKNSISIDTVNNKKCYKVIVSEEKCKKIYWIDENNKKTIKAKIVFIDGKTYEYEYELQFNVTKNKDIELPDISEYKQ